MDFWASMTVIAKHWRVFTAAILLTAVATVGILKKVHPAYEGKSTVLLVPPKISTTTTNPQAFQNPYLGFGNLNTVAAILAADQTNPATQAQLVKEGVSGSFTSNPDPNGNIPEVQITVTGATEDATRTSINILTNWVGQRLTQEQVKAGAPPETWITTSVISPPFVSADNKSRFRVAAAVGGIGVGLSVASAFAAESLSRRSPNRRTGRRERDDRLEVPAQFTRPSGEVGPAVDAQQAGTGQENQGTRLVNEVNPGLRNVQRRD